MSVRTTVSRPAVLARGVAICLGLLVLADAAALTAPLQFATSLEESTWQVQTGRMRCGLRHAIPDYGVAEFTRAVGQPLQVRIDLPKPPVTAQQVVLRAVPSAWNHTLGAQDLGTHLLTSSARRFDLTDAAAQTLFDALELGLNVELGFGPVAAPVQAVVRLSSVRFLLAAPEFQTCLAELSVAPARQATASAKPRAQVASLKSPYSDAQAAVSTPAPETAVEPDPYIRTDVKLEDASVSKPETKPADQQRAPKDAGAGLKLVEEVALIYGASQDELSEAARLELGSFIREYLARQSRDLVLIAGSAGNGPLTRRRALEIKGHLVRNGVPAARVLIHVQGEKLPQRDGQPIEAPSDATRMAVWQVR